MGNQMLCLRSDPLVGMSKLEYWMLGIHGTIKPTMKDGANLNPLGATSSSTTLCLASVYDHHAP